jgi:hypothetical protein
LSSKSLDVEKISGNDQVTCANRYVLIQTRCADWWLCGYYYRPHGLWSTASI